MLRYLLLVMTFSFFSFANISPLSKTYDAMDNLLSQANQEDETTSYEYDGADRLTKTTYPDSTTTTNTYDAVGKKSPEL